MLKYLGHELVYFNSKVSISSPESYTGYKCKKCNCIINYVISSGVSSYYWMFNDGADYNDESSISWHFLELTCEEEIIKKLLE